MQREGQILPTDVCMEVLLKSRRTAGKEARQEPWILAAADGEWEFKSSFTPKGRDWKHSQASVDQGGLQLFIP